MSWASTVGQATEFFRASTNVLSIPIEVVPSITAARPVVNFKEQSLAKKQCVVFVHQNNGQHCSSQSACCHLISTKERDV